MTIAPRKSLEPWIHDWVDYYPHQITGCRKLSRLTSFLLADDMGLGKSLQALTIFTMDVVRNWAKTAIVVCPVTLKSNWEDELGLFTRYPFVKLEGTPAKRNKQIEHFAYEITGPKVLIVNYEQVNGHLNQLNAIGFDVAIFDEAHYLMNPKSIRSKAGLALKARRSFLLTGTPMLNRPNNLWSILHRISPEAYPNYWGFTTRYCAFGGFQNKQIIGAKNQEELKRRLNEVMLRRLKGEVLKDRKEPYYIQRKVDLTPEQRKLYDMVADELCLDVPELEGDEPIEIENSLVKYLILKQICGTTATVLGEKHDSSNKLDLAAEEAFELIQNGHRVVTFTQFRQVQAAFVRRLEKMGVPSWQLHGDIKTADRVGVVKEWGASSSTGALVCMLQVAGIGLNMVQARHCQFLDKLWVPGLNKQAVDRLDRIGQSTAEPVTVLEYLARDTVELRVEEVLRGKIKLNQAIVEQEDWKKAIVSALRKKAA